MAWLLMIAQASCSAVCFLLGVMDSLMSISGGGFGVASKAYHRQIGTFPSAREVA